MTVKEFDRLTIRDFENWATRDAIRKELRALENFRANLEPDNVMKEEPK